MAKTEGCGNNSFFIMAPVVGDTNTISDEEYLVLRAKDALKSDAFAAKAWMITAKTLFPNNFAVQVRIFLSVQIYVDLQKRLLTLLK